MPLTPLLIREYMEACIELAKLSPYRITKPYVGAMVISSSQEIVGIGYKSFLEGCNTITVHAERKALDDAGSRAVGATLITSLAPCIPTKGRHFFQSCTSLILEREISQVIIGHLDYYLPAPPSHGINYLRNNGVEVIEFFELKNRINGELLPKKIE